MESEENPGGYDQRAILNPKDVGKLIEYGVQVYVQKDIGTGIRVSDSEYEIMIIHPVGKPRNR